MIFLWVCITALQLITIWLILGIKMTHEEQLEQTKTFEKEFVVDYYERNKDGKK
jgi:hypothetical protein